MSKHKTIPIKMRQQVYDKYNHHCAYCGCHLEFSEMQVDHLKSVYAHTEYEHDMTDEEMQSIENLMPSCRQCNFYKSTFDIETFRNRLTEVLMKNLQKEFSYKLAVKYGLIEEHIKPVIFFFEKQQNVDEINV